MSASLEFLLGRSRKELQVLAKAWGIKANAKSEEIRDGLLAKGFTPTEAPCTRNSQQDHSQKTAGNETARSGPDKPVSEPLVNEVQSPARRRRPGALHVASTKPSSQDIALGISGARLGNVNDTMDVNRDPRTRSASVVRKLQTPRGVPGSAEGEAHAQQARKARRSSRQSCMTPRKRCQGADGEESFFTPGSNFSGLASTTPQQLDAIGRDASEKENATSPPSKIAACCAPERQQATEVDSPLGMGPVQCGAQSQTQGNSRVRAPMAALQVKAAKPQRQSSATPGKSLQHSASSSPADSTASPTLSSDGAAAHLTAPAHPHPRAPKGYRKLGVTGAKTPRAGPSRLEVVGKPVAATMPVPAADSPDRLLASPPTRPGSEKARSQSTTRNHPPSAADPASAVHPSTPPASSAGQHDTAAMATIPEQRATARETAGEPLQTATDGHKTLAHTKAIAPAKPAAGTGYAAAGRQRAKLAAAHSTGSPTESTPMTAISGLPEAPSPGDTPRDSSTSSQQPSTHAKQRSASRIGRRQSLSAPAADAAPHAKPSPIKTQPLAAAALPDEAMDSPLLFPSTLSASDWQALSLELEPATSRFSTPVTAPNATPPPGPLVASKGPTASLQPQVPAAVETTKSTPPAYAVAPLRSGGDAAKPLSGSLQSASADSAGGPAGKVHFSSDSSDPRAARRRNCVSQPPSRSRVEQRTAPPAAPQPCHPANVAVKRDRSHAAAAQADGCPAFERTRGPADPTDLHSTAALTVGNAITDEESQPQSLPFVVPSLPGSYPAAERKYVARSNAHVEEQAAGMLARAVPPTDAGLPPVGAVPHNSDVAPRRCPPYAAGFAADRVSPRVSSSTSPSAARVAEFTFCKPVRASSEHTPPFPSVHEGSVHRQQVPEGLSSNGSFTSSQSRLSRGHDGSARGLLPSGDLTPERRAFMRGQQNGMWLGQKSMELDQLEDAFKLYKTNSSRAPSSGDAKNPKHAHGGLRSASAFPSPRGLPRAEPAGFAANYGAANAQVVPRPATTAAVGQACSAASPNKRPRAPGVY